MEIMEKRNKPAFFAASNKPPVYMICDSSQNKNVKKAWATKTA